jgi:hypothetical protein
MATWRPPDRSYREQLADSVSPLDVSHFRLLKALFYSGLMTAALVIARQDAGADPQVLYIAFGIFLTVVWTELKEIEIGTAVGRISATFNGDYAEDETDDDDQDDAE